MAELITGWSVLASMTVKQALVLLYAADADVLANLAVLRMVDRFGTCFLGTQHERQ